MTVPTSVDQADVAHGPVIRDGVRALAVRAIRTRARAARSRRRFPCGPVRIADHRVSWPRKSRWDVVLASMGLGLVVDARQVGVGCLATINLVFLEPKAELHVIAEELGADLLVGVQHDALVVATLQAPRILPGVAGRVLLFLQVSGWRIHTVLHKLSTVLAPSLTELASQALVANARSRALAGQCDLCGPVRSVVSEGLRLSHGGNEVDGLICIGVEGVVVLGGPSQGPREHQSPHACFHYGGQHLHARS
mmetsp:Transcript_39782/g.92030  ORF Transcript_39782/g.92030 Transcript_39782/m.92030 type:complete len:251 (+) Transcript_39782:382-1134(+)